MYKSNALIGFNGMESNDRNSLFQYDMRNWVFKREQKNIRKLTSSILLSTFWSPFSWRDLLTRKQKNIIHTKAKLAPLHQHQAFPFKTVSSEHRKLVLFYRHTQSKWKCLVQFPLKTATVLSQNLAETEPSPQEKVIKIKMTFILQRKIN